MEMIRDVQEQAIIAELDTMTTDDIMVLKFRSMIPGGNEWYELRRQAAKAGVAFSDLSDLAREHDFQMKDMESMKDAKEGGGARKEAEEVKVARTFTLKCFKCFGNHVARECEMRVMCRSCKPEETKKNSHCTKAHPSWVEWKNKMKAREEERGVKRGGEEIPAAKTKKQKMSEKFFKQNKMSNEEKKKFLNTIVKYIQWEDKEEEEGSEEEEEMTEASLNKVTAWEDPEDGEEEEEQCLQIEIEEEEKKKKEMKIRVSIRGDNNREIHNQEVMLDTGSSKSMIGEEKVKEWGMKKK